VLSKVQLSNKQEGNLIEPIYTPTKLVKSTLKVWRKKYQEEYNEQRKITECIKIETNYDLNYFF